MENIFKYWNKEQKERIIKLLNIVFETNEEINDKNRNNKTDSIRTSNREDSLQD